MELDRDQIVEIARNITQTAKYGFAGRTKYKVDCYGLPYVIANEIGYPIPNLKYAREFTGDYFKETFYRIFEAKGKGYRAPGAVIALRQVGRPCHIGILTEERNGVWHMVNANLGARTVKEEPIGDPNRRNRDIMEVADFRIPE